MHPVNPSGGITTTRSRYQPRTSSRLASTRDEAAPPKASSNPNTRAAVGSVVTTASRLGTTKRSTRPLPTPPLSSIPKLPTRASPHTPLRPRDRNQNVLSLTATRSTIKSSVFSMPPPTERPRQPQLSAAAARAANRTPLTPKVAAPKGPPVVTPLVRRTQNQQTPTLPAAQIYNRDETTTTPTASYLSHNITPRSGPRQSRVESVNSTPNSTPNPERTSDLWDDSRSSGGSGTGGLGAPPISALNYDSGRQNPSGDSAVESHESKFFYANNVKTTQLVANQRPASVPQKPTAFFYANGTSADNNKRRTSPPMNPAILTSTPEPTATSKFFYANGTPDVSQKTSLPISSSASTVSSSSRVLPKRPSTSQSTTGTMGLNPSIPPRPLSPVKALSTPTLQTQKIIALPPSQPLRTTQLASPPILPTIPSPTQKRQVTIDTSQRAFKGHSRTGSVPTIEPMRLTIASNSPEPCSPPLSPGLGPGPSQPAMTMASLLQVADELDEESEIKDGDSPAELQSPTKSTYSNDAISELVANARRERKVQDLEITNASLEAINRTLERQLRKQTAELRRYRRLSRSGRISLASAPSSRVASEAFTEPPIDLSDVDEDEDTEEEDEDSFDDDSDLSGADAISAGPLSPSARMTARRKRDEKRLQIDLTKHQELLVDSQKMNQSLKRCLNWTEVLIKEGHRALAYRVRVSDVELGGHVLAPPDEEDETASHHGDTTSQSIDIGLAPPWTKGPQDRDSGIELPVEGG